MYKILIADDEGIVTDSLQFIIEKRFGDACRIAVAKNGRQAIELADAFQPDIAFLDIQMPGINGLKALEEIREFAPKVKPVILTAYDNFDYATEALRLGAADYILKPVSRKTIIELLTRIMGEIDAERQKRRDELRIREKMETVTPFIENGFVLSLIIQDRSGDGEEQYRRVLGIKESYGCIMTLEWGGGDADQALRKPAGSVAPAQCGPEKAVEIIKVYFKTCVSGMMEDRIVCAIPYQEPEIGQKDRLQMMEKAQSMLASLKNAVGLDFKVGIGSVRPWNLMRESYQEALNALRHGKDNVTHVYDLSLTNFEKKQRKVLEEAVLKAVSGGIEFDARNEAAVFAACLVRDKSCCLPDERLQMAELFMLACRKVTEQGGVCHDEQETLSALLSAQTEEELTSLFVDAIAQLAKAAVIKEKETYGIIPRAKNFIKNNFRRDLSLEEAALSVGISPYYFSKLFKEETGTNFTEYLTGLRIEEAKRLLLNPKFSIKQVCLDSGYSDPNYFSRIFKKWTGLTPSEFREGVRDRQLRES